MDDSSLPSSHLLGSVPAVIVEEKGNTVSSGASNANLQIFPPGNGGYQAPGTPYGGDEQATSSWKGYFTISSYSPYFNVDTDVVAERIISSVYPMDGFFRKIEGNPDLYGPAWISTTLVFMLAAFGNCATYLIHKRTDPMSPWNFDVNYVNWAALVIYGYAVLVPTAFYFLLQYFRSSASVIRLWCMWGYSLFIFVPSSLLLLAPVEIFRWIIIVLAGAASSWFSTLNLKAYTERGDLMILVVSACVLHFVLALTIKIVFFPSCCIRCWSTMLLIISFTLPTVFVIWFVLCVLGWFSKKVYVQVNVKESIYTPPLLHSAPSPLPYQLQEFLAGSGWVGSSQTLL